MCVNNENVPAEELETFRTFVNGLGDTPLAQLLTGIGVMIEAGGSICLAQGQELDQIRQAMGQAPQQQQVAPGIYPPASFGNDAPDTGYGQYL